MKARTTLASTGRDRSFFRRKSLTVTTLVWLLVLGTGLWLALDGFYQKSASQFLAQTFRQDVRHQAGQVQNRLHLTLRAYAATARVYAKYLGSQKQTNTTHGAVDTTNRSLIQRRLSSWLDEANASGGSIPIDYAIVLGSHHDILAAYAQHPGSMPERLANPDSSLFDNALGRSVIARLGGEDYLVTAAMIQGRTGGAARLLLASRFERVQNSLPAVEDSAYMSYAIVDIKTGHAIARRHGLPEQITPMTAGTGSHMTLVYQQPVDASEPGGNLALMAWVDRSKLAGVNQSLVSFERRQRALTILAFTLLLLGLSWSLKRRLVRIDQNIQSYSKQLGIDSGDEAHGDRIDRINLRLNRFGEEMIAETRALEYQARHDPLTSLPNRALLLERLHAEIHRTELERNAMALLIMDLDRFKEVNDTLGHHMGDRLLQEVGRRLTSVLRRTDMVARLGGDEFAIILPGAELSQVSMICRKIIAIMDKPIHIEDMYLRAGISIGVAICPEHGHDASLLMRRADIAMYDAKQHQNGYSIYAENKDQSSIRSLGLSTELREAIERDQLLLEYQPQVDMNTGKIACVEALVRWQHPGMGLIPPDEFISLAEQTGVIRPLTLWVIDHALAQTAFWKKAGLQLKLSINLSVRCLQDRQLPSQVEALLDKHGVDPGAIVLEVTESAIMSDPITARRVMRRLSNMGFHMSIDDFGTGYSSLSYLKQLPVDEIKIDKSFVRKMDENENDAVIVRATIDLAHNLGLKVVAEGVESSQVWSEIQTLGCDSAQGYFIREPVKAEELARWMRSSEWDKTSRVVGEELSAE